MNRNAGAPLRLARNAAIRGTAALLIRRLGELLPFGAGVGALGIVATRTAGVDLNWTLLLLAPLVAALVVSLAEAARARWSLIRGAVELDARLGLQSRIANAVQLSAARGDPFAMMAVREGEAASAGVRVAQAVPICFGRGWLVALVLTGAGVAAGFYVPLRSPAQTAGEKADAAVAAEQVRRAAEAIRQASAETGESAAPPRELEAIAELERELREGRLDPLEATSLAARSIEQAAERLSDDADRMNRARDALRDRLARSAERAAADSSLAEALKKGDLEAAAREAEALAENLDQLAPDERRALARELRELSGALGENDARPGAAEDDLAALERELAERGLSPESIAEALEKPTAEEAARELQKQGVPAEAAQRVAERLEENRRQQEAEQATERRVDELRESLRNAAEQLEKPPSGADRPAQATPPTNEPPDAARQREPKPGERDPKAPQEHRSGERLEGRPGEQPQPQGQAQPGQERRPGEAQSQPDEKAPPAGQGRPREAPATRPEGERPGGAPRETATPQGGEERKPGGKQPPPGEAEARPSSESERREEGAQRPNPEAQPQPGTAPMPRPAGQPATDPTGVPQRGEKPDVPGKDADPGGGEEQKPGVEELAERLRRAADLAKQASKNDRAARELRRQAEEMLGSMSPAEREKLEDLARRLGGPDGPGAINPEGTPARPLTGESETVTVPRPADAPAPAERVIAEWTGERAGPDPSVSRREMAQHFQQAAKSAERAVEQQVVPQQRRELVRRVFRRFAERAEDGAPR